MCWTPPSWLEGLEHWFGVRHTGLQRCEVLPDSAWAPHPLSFLVCKIWIMVKLVDDKTANKGPSTVLAGGGVLNGSALFVQATWMPPATFEVSGKLSPLLPF